MKKEVMEYIRSLGGVPHYAGNTSRDFITRNENGDIEHEYIGSVKTIYIEHNASWQIKDMVFVKFGFNLPIKIALA